MRKTWTAAFGVALLTFALACGAGGSEGGGASSGSIEISTTADGADALLAELKDGVFPRKIQTKENADAFLVLAARDMSDTATARAALLAMAESWTHSEKVTKKQLVNEDYTKVVLAYLDHADGGVQQAAMDAAGALIRQDPPNAEAVAKLVAIAGKGGASQYAVLDRLWELKDWHKDATTATVFTSALDASEPQNVSMALFRLEMKAFGLVEPEGARAKAQALLAHADPGVRGRAALFLGKLAKSKDEKAAAGDAILPLLDDKHPFTRSAAAAALGDLGHKPAIAKMVALIDDSEKNTYDIKDFKLLNGVAGNVHHDGSAWSRVDDAALRALEAMSRSAKVGSLKLPKVRHDHLDEDLGKQKEAVRTWYDSVKGSL